MKKDLILVVGASGHVGTELVRILKAEGHLVRATTSGIPKDKETVRINVATGEGIVSAFEGVDKAFLLSPPGFADHYQVLAPLIQEAKRRSLKKVVLMTALGANAIESAPFRRAEIELEKSGLNYNIIRPNWFMQNFSGFWIQGILQQRKILLPAGTAKTSFMDTKDISAVAAKLLTTDHLSNKAFDLTGPEALDHQQVASEISLVIGQTVVYEEIAPDQLKTGLLAAGLPQDYVSFLLMIFGFLREGYNAAVNDNVKLILGRDPSTFAQFAKQTKAAWV